MDEKEKELKEKQDNVLKELLLSVAKDYSDALDKCLETWNMEQCMYNLGYAAYFINRGLKDKDVLDKWKEIFNKALEIGKKIELHNAEELQKKMQSEKEKEDESKEGK